MPFFFHDNFKVWWFEKNDREKTNTQTLSKRVTRRENKMEDLNETQKNEPLHKLTKWFDYDVFICIIIIYNKIKAFNLNVICVSHAHHSQVFDIIFHAYRTQYITTTIIDNTAPITVKFFFSFFFRKFFSFIQRKKKKRICSQ